MSKCWWKLKRRKTGFYSCQIFSDTGRSWDSATGDTICLTVIRAILQRVGESVESVIAKLQQPENGRKG